MQKPNIVFILADDMGAWAMGCAGNSDVKTPNIDALAAQGMRYENFFCASPVCSPARASIATGTMPSFHGVHDWIAKGNFTSAQHPQMTKHSHFQTPDTGVDYLADVPTYMSLLQKAGYRCALSGKWHLGSQDCPRPEFESWYTIGTGGCDYFDPDIFENGAFSAPKQYVTDLITHKAVDFLADFAQDTTPFYLSVHYTAPHSPWSPEHHPASYLALYDHCDFTATPDLPVHPNQIYSAPIGDTPEKRRENLAGYYASITAMDAGIGEIVAALKANGQYENTVICFTADNGMNMGHHGVWGKGNGTYPPNMYDTSVKVPFVLSNLPGHTGICETYATHCDVFETMAELAGVSYAPLPSQCGKSLLAPNREQDAVVVCDEYGIVRMLRTKTQKFIQNYKTGEAEFYDLTCDPEECDNRIDDESYTQDIAQLRETMEAWFARFESPQNAGRQYDVRGRGQFDLCHTQGAFSDVLSFYHPNRHSENVNPDNSY